MRAVLFVLVSLLAGCSFFDGGPPPEAKPVDGPIVLDLIEQRRNQADEGPSEPSLWLYAQTEEIYPCVNYRLVTDFRRIANVLDLRVQGYAEANVCFTALGPATDRRSVSLQEGTYALFLSHLGTSDRYTLRVREDRISVSPQAGSASSFGHTLYWRHPPDSFVYTCGTNRNEGYLCDDFESMLLEHLALTPVEVPDEGWWPYPRTSNGHWYDAPARVYRYESEADFERAGELLREFTRSVLVHHTGDALILENWKGVRYQSWLIEREEG